MNTAGLSSSAGGSAAFLKTFALLLMQPPLSGHLCVLLHIFAVVIKWVVYFFNWVFAFSFKALSGLSDWNTWGPREDLPEWVSFLEDSIFL